MVKVAPGGSRSCTGKFWSCSERESTEHLWDMRSCPQPPPKSIFLVFRFSCCNFPATFCHMHPRSGPPLLGGSLQHFLPMLRKPSLSSHITHHTPQTYSPLGSLQVVASHTDCGAQVWCSTTIRRLTSTGRGNQPFSKPLDMYFCSHHPVGAGPSPAPHWSASTHALSAKLPRSGPSPASFRARLFSILISWL